MTKEEILKMEPGRELDALVAKKVMEIKLHWDDEEEQSYKIADSPFGEVLKAFNPSTDISAAWEVVEKMKHDFNIFTYMHNEKEFPNGWICKFKGSSVQGIESAPVAICKAALLACLEGK